jgi:3-oxoadipate enol-lactonase
MPFFSVQDSRQIHYEIVPGVLPQSTLFIHGNVASLRWWQPALEVWGRQFSNQIGDAILVEFPGCGQSTPLKIDEPVELDKFADEFLALTQHLGWNHLNLVGHSTGGAIAALMLAKAPELFHRAVLLDPVSPTGIRIPEGLKDTYKKMAKDEQLLAKILKTAVYGLESDSDFFRDVLVKDAMLAVNHAGFSVVEALGLLDLRSSCKNIKHPVLVLHGEHDTTSILPGSEAWVKLLGNGKLVVMPGVGHSPNVEKPEDFVSQVNRFFAFGQ